MGINLLYSIPVWSGARVGAVLYVQKNASAVDVISMVFVVDMYVLLIVMRLFNVLSIVTKLAISKTMVVTKLVVNKNGRKQIFHA